MHVPMGLHNETKRRKKVYAKESENLNFSKL